MHGKAIIGFVAAVAAVTSGYLLVSQTREGAKRNELALQAELAADTLPAGTEAAWMAYVLRRLNVAMQPVGDTIKVADMFADTVDRSIFVSRNTPYTFSCDPIMGASVEFGQGDTSILVPIYGAMLLDGAEPPPPLDVHPDSVAAKALSNALCERLVIGVQAIMVGAALP